MYLYWSSVIKYEVALIKYEVLQVIYFILIYPFCVLFFSEITFQILEIDYVISNLFSYLCSMPEVLSVKCLFLKIAVNETFLHLFYLIMCGRWKSGANCNSH